MGHHGAPWLLAVTLCWPYPAVRAQTPGAVIHHLQVVVPASSGAWLGAGLIAARGDLILVIAEGRVEVTSDDLSPAAARPYLTTSSVDANGIGGRRGDDGTLEIAVGSGPVESIGARGFLFAADSGSVKLRVRARHPDRNAGSFRVDVVHVPGVLIPAVSHGKR